MNKKRWHSYLLIIANYLLKIFPIKQERFYFCSYHGQYTDSPKQISEALHEIYPHAEYIWEISEKCHEELPNYIKVVEPFSFHAVRLRTTSKVVVENYMGYYWGYSDPSSLSYRILLHIKRRNQLNISTWHGTPYKKIGLDEPKNQKKRLDFYSSSDWLLCNSQYFADLFKRLTLEKIPLLMTGSPRNDLLFSATEYDKAKIRRKLKLPQDKRILLFAPTFRRGDLEMSGLYQIEHIDIKNLLQSFGNKFGGEWIFVLRLHDSVLLEVEKGSINNSLIYSGNIGDDIGEYNAIADAMLTDYSGCFYDYILTRKPCFLYCPDFSHYADEERGFYFNVEELPFSCAKTSVELLDFISIFSPEQYQDRVDKFLTRIGNIDDGHGTCNVINLIQKYLE